MNDKNITLEKMHENTIDITIEKAAFVRGKIYDYLKEFEKENHIYLEDKYRTLFRNSIYNKITRITLIDMVTKVALIIFIDKGGYRIAEYKKTDTEPYHDMLVRKHIEQLNNKNHEQNTNR